MKKRRQSLASLASGIMGVNPLATFGTLPNRNQGPKKSVSNSSKTDDATSSDEDSDSLPGNSVHRHRMGSMPAGAQRKGQTRINK